MSAQACRDALNNDLLLRDHAAHAGLLLSRYLRIPAKDSEKQHPEERAALYKAAIGAVKAVKLLYSRAYERRCAALRSVGPHAEDLFRVDGRLIVRLGGENVLETGIGLHHSYGVPIIPGSALKGLASHYCDQVWGQADQEFKIAGISEKDETGTDPSRQGKYHRVIFGADDDSGHIVFHDAWISPETLNTSLVLDVMTPHHGDYYSEERDDETGEIKPPSDFDDPNPVTFLSVTGTFHIVVSCDESGEQGEKWVALTLRLLSEALDRWGVGGKTSSGYGRLKQAIKPNGPPPNTKQDEQAVWLKEIREDGSLQFVTIDGEVFNSHKDYVQGVGKRNPLTVGKWYLRFGNKSIKAPRR